MMDLDAVFAENGLFAQHLTGYRVRSQQIEMARAVAQAIAQQSVLLAEAGTGTGKSYAYLVPTLLSARKTIIATATKTLQEQLYYRDIPQLRALLAVPVSVALLKGRANYVCHHYLARTTASGRFSSVAQARALQHIVHFVKRSRDGDKAGCRDVEENSPLWQQVTSTRDSCLGADCDYAQQCFVNKARRKALAADIIIVNQHLFFADLCLKDEGDGELLPDCHTVIIDEAHQLPEIASIFWGERFTSGQLAELLHELSHCVAKDAKDCMALVDAIAALHTQLQAVRALFSHESLRLAQHALREHTQFQMQLSTLLQQMAILLECLASQAGRSEALGNVLARLQQQAALLSRWQQASSGEQIAWFELTAHGFQLHLTPLDIAQPFQRRLQASPRAWIFTSATLAVNGQFEHYKAQLGLESTTCCHQWLSPFDYPTRALLYVPKQLPTPNSSEHTLAVVESAWPLLRCSQGRAFLLFTSLKAMYQAKTHLLAKLAAQQLNYPLLVQGDAPRGLLLQQFRTSAHAILLASHTFWEGVDVKGEQLQLVVIDKLPFAPPDDPVVAARIEHMLRCGGNAFMDYQLPRAAIILKQGAGRLIRDENDYGVLMIADPRLVEKPYGKILWRSLPPMARTRDLEVAEQFFRQMQQSNLKELSVAL